MPYGYTLYVNGKIIQSGGSTADGVYKQYHDLSGTLVNSYTLVNGKYHGKREQFQDGVTRVLNYKHGKFHGLQTRQDGVILSSEFYIDNVIIFSTEVYSDGEKYCTYHEFDNGNKTRTVYKSHDNYHKVTFKSTSAERSQHYEHSMSYLYSSQGSGIVDIHLLNQMNDIFIDFNEVSGRVLISKDRVRINCFDKYGFEFI